MTVMLWTSAQNELSGLTPGPILGLSRIVLKGVFPRSKEAEGET